MLDGVRSFFGGFWAQSAQDNEVAEQKKELSLNGEQRLKRIYFLPNEYYPVEVCGDALFEWVNKFFDQQSEPGTALLWIDQDGKIFLSYTPQNFLKPVQHLALCGLDYDKPTGQLFYKETPVVMYEQIIEYIALYLDEETKEHIAGLKQTQLMSESHASGNRLSLIIENFNVYSKFLPIEEFEKFFTNLRAWYGEVRDGVICPITCEKIITPYIAHDGYSYEKANIEKYINESGKTLKSPVTGDDLSSNKIYHNLALQEVLDFFSEIEKDFNDLLEHTCLLYDEWRTQSEKFYPVDNHLLLDQTLVEKVKMIAERVPMMGLCSIEYTRFKNPILIESGHTFERTSISDWLTNRKGPVKNPINCIEIKDKTLMLPNRSLVRSLRVLQHLEWALPVLTIFARQLAMRNEWLYQQGRAIILSPSSLSSRMNSLMWSFRLSSFSSLQLSPQVLGKEDDSLDIQVDLREMNEEAIIEMKEEVSSDEAIDHLEERMSLLRLKQ